MIISRHYLTGCAGGVALLLLAGCSSSGITRATEGVDPRALWENVVLAHGGPELPARERRRSRVQVERGNTPPVNGTLTSIFAAPDRQLWAFETSDGDRLLQIFDGEDAIELVNGRPSDRVVTQEAMRRVRYRGLLQEFSKPSARPLSLIGEEFVSGRRHWVLERQLTSNEIWRVWIDARSFLIQRIVCTTREEAGVKIQEDWLFDYERHGRRMIPSRKVTLVNGKKVSESWLLEIDDNPELDPELFDLKSFPG